jgi:hypothetical protein
MGNILGSMSCVLDTSDAGVSQVLKGLYIQIGDVCSTSDIVSFGPQGSGKTSQIGEMILATLYLSTNADPQATAFLLQLANTKAANTWCKIDEYAVKGDDIEIDDDEESADMGPGLEYQSRAVRSEKQQATVRRVYTNARREGDVAYDMVFLDGHEERFYQEDLFPRAREGEPKLKVDSKLWVFSSGYALCEMSEDVKRVVLYGILAPCMRKIYDGTRATELQPCGFISNISANSSTTLREIRIIRTDTPGLCYSVIPAPHGFLKKLLELYRKTEGERTMEEKGLMNELRQLYIFLKGGNMYENYVTINIHEVADESELPIDAWADERRWKAMDWGKTKTLVFPASTSIATVATQVVYMMELAISVEKNPACRNVVIGVPTFALPEGVAYSDTAGVDGREQHWVRLEQLFSVAQIRDVIGFFNKDPRSANTSTPLQVVARSIPAHPTRKMTVVVSVEANYNPYLDDRRAETKNYESQWRDNLIEAIKNSTPEQGVPLDVNRVDVKIVFSILAFGAILRMSTARKSRASTKFSAAYKLLEESNMQSMYAVLHGNEAIIREKMEALPEKFTSVIQTLQKIKNFSSSGPNQVRGDQIHVQPKISDFMEAVESVVTEDPRKRDGIYFRQYYFMLESGEVKNAPTFIENIQARTYVVAGDMVYWREIAYRVVTIQNAYVTLIGVDDNMEVVDNQTGRLLEVPIMEVSLVNCDERKPVTFYVQDARWDCALSFITGEIDKIGNLVEHNLQHLTTMSSRVQAAKHVIKERSLHIGHDIRNYVEHLYHTCTRKLSMVMDAGLKPATLDAAVAMSETVETRRMVIQNFFQNELPSIVHCDASKRNQDYRYDFYKAFEHALFENGKDGIKAAVHNSLKQSPPTIKGVIDANRDAIIKKVGLYVLNSIFTKDVIRQVSEQMQCMYRAICRLLRPDKKVIDDAMNKLVKIRNDVQQHIVETSVGNSGFESMVESVVDMWVNEPILQDLTQPSDSCPLVTAEEVERLRKVLMVEAGHYSPECLLGVENVLLTHVTNMSNEVAIVENLCNSLFCMGPDFYNWLMEQIPTSFDMTRLSNLASEMWKRLNIDNIMEPLTKGSSVDVLLNGRRKHAAGIYLVPGICQYLGVHICICIAEDDSKTLLQWTIGVEGTPDKILYFTPVEYNDDDVSSSISEQLFFPRLSGDVFSLMTMTNISEEAATGDASMNFNELELDIVDDSFFDELGITFDDDYNVNFIDDAKMPAADGDGFAKMPAIDGDDFAKMPAIDGDYFANNDSKMPAVANDDFANLTVVMI